MGGEGTEAAANRTGREGTEAAMDRRTERCAEEVKDWFEGGEGAGEWHLRVDLKSQLRRFWSLVTDTKSWLKLTVVDVRVAVRRD